MGGRKFRLDVHRKNEKRKKLKHLNSSGKDTERKKKQTTKNVWRKKKPEQPNPPEKELDPPEKEPDQSNPRENAENDITLPTIAI